MGQKLFDMRPKYRTMENPFLLKKGPIYDSEIERVEKALKEFRDKMNVLPTETLRNVIPPNISEAIDEAKKELKARAVIVDDATKMIEQIMSLPEKAREAWNWITSLAWVVPILIIGGILAILACILVKTRIYWIFGFRVGHWMMRILGRVVGLKRKRDKTKIAVAQQEEGIELCVIEPSAPREPIEERAYILSYMPPRVLMISNEAEKLPAIEVMVEERPIRALVDTCAGITMCRESLARKLGLKIYKSGVKACRAANKSAMQMVGRTFAKLSERKELDLRNAGSGR